MCFPAEDSGFLVHGTLGVSCCAEGQYTADAWERGRDKSKYGYEGGEEREKRVIKERKQDELLYYGCRGRYLTAKVALVGILIRKWITQDTLQHLLLQ